MTPFGSKGRRKQGVITWMHVTAILVFTLGAWVATCRESFGQDRAVDSTGGSEIDGPGPALFEESPWGVATGAEWMSAYPIVNPMLTRAGVQWLRSFYEWETIEPQRGVFDWKLSDRLITNATANRLRITFPLAYLASWASANGGTRSFPIKDMRYWHNYVSHVVRRYRKSIQYWEVWNEFNGSFAENGSPELYAKLVREAWQAARAEDPDAKIGMSVANFDVHFLDAAIKAGAAGHFDYICVHPYERLVALGNGDEAGFLSMAAALRRVLSSNGLSPDMPLWITEIGSKAPVAPDPAADAKQASLLVKAYVLAMSQGFSRVFWFEARGPAYGGDADHGLIRADYTLRPSYRAFQTMTDLLGSTPKRAGWLKVGQDGFGFLFNLRGTEPVLVAWAPMGRTVQTHFDGNIEQHDLDGKRQMLNAGQPLVLTDRPVFLVGLPRQLIEQARANARQPYTWGNDYRNAEMVTVRMGSSNIDEGLRQVNSDTTRVVTVGNRSWRRTDFSAAGGEGHYVYFAADPGFVADDAASLKITARVRRLAPDRLAGMSLNYESRAGYVDAGYQNIPEGSGWHELHWTVKDANFAGQWGWNLRLNGIASPTDFMIEDVQIEKVRPR